ncbi:membrane bound O-acyl transferase family-domain-containing protein [Suillus clintonianus]|uniref:membrane bound O-acyl transferase family-domain-containing protein n=1 Tax=Suillus clintonianus TaxID=1904413 RepID=UPI001B87A7F3|nr:membrane bound O-acyl transferase family-domain-containing protein [Suillus clintonianus]KAG2121322.1 membrane bound O-acyl transferase family-domain-containing protein [Suillus clintonianus]
MYDTDAISIWWIAFALPGSEPIRTQESEGRKIPAFVLQLGITLDLRAPWNVATCVAIIFVCLTCIRHAKTDVLFLDYFIGMAIAGLAMDAIHMILLVRPLHTFHHQKQTRSAHELPWFPRFIWAAQLCASPRGVGWNHQVKNLPEHRAKSKQEFVVSCLTSAAEHFLWFDLAQFYIRHNPVYQSAAAFASQNFARRILACSGYLVFYYCMGVTVHSLISAFAVSCTGSEPSSWPNLFGKWKDAYTIRRFWGRTWHQFLRRFLAPFGQKMAVYLGFKSGTNGSSYTQLYTAFFVSGIAHLGGDAVLNSSRLGVSFPFFIYQALGITFEDMVIAAARRAGVQETKWTRKVGYVWVICWFIVTVTPWVTAVGVAGVEGGGTAIPSKFFPPSIFEILVRSVGK